MKRIFIILCLIAMMFSLFACSLRGSDNGTNNMGNGSLSFTFDAAGNYTGFDNLPQNYTIEQAIEDGCYVRKGASGEVGGDNWRYFIENSNNKKDTAIRIMCIFDDATFYTDLFFVDGSYRIFDSSSEDLSDREYKYILELSGRMPNAERDSYFAILTDDETLTFDKVVKSSISSDSVEIRSISPYRLIFAGVV